MTPPATGDVGLMSRTRQELRLALLPLGSPVVWSVGQLGGEVPL